MAATGRQPVWEFSYLTLLHSEREKLHTILAFLSAVGLRSAHTKCGRFFCEKKTTVKVVSVGTDRSDQTVQSRSDLGAV